jgi:hypothetical protein
MGNVELGHLLRNQICEGLRDSVRKREELQKTFPAFLSKPKF